MEHKHQYPHQRADAALEKKMKAMKAECKKRAFDFILLVTKSVSAGCVLQLSGPTGTGTVSEFRRYMAGIQMHHLEARGTAIDRFEELLGRVEFEDGRMESIHRVEGELAQSMRLGIPLLLDDIEDFSDEVIERLRDVVQQRKVYCTFSQRWIDAHRNWCLIVRARNARRRDAPFSLQPVKPGSLLFTEADRHRDVLFSCTMQLH